MRPKVLRTFTKINLLAAVLILPLLFHAQSVPQASIDHAAALLNASGLEYHNTSMPSVWTLHFKGAHEPDIKVVLTVSSHKESELILMTTVATAKQLPTDAEFRQKLLKLNYHYDQVRVGLDEAGNLIVRFDASLRITDDAYFKAVIGQVKNAADEIYGQISPSFKQ